MDRRREDISIVVTVYNHERTLGRALDSILRQEMPYIGRIYCLDDASTDGSGRILEDYATRHPSRIKVFTNPRNLGSGRASHLFNRLELPGRYWCILEGDDFWIGRDKLKHQIAFLDANADFVGCSGNTVMLDEATGERRIIAPTAGQWNYADLYLLSKKYRFYVHTSSIVWRHIHRATGFYWPPDYAHPPYYGDVMLMHLMLRDGGKMKNIPRVMSCYRVTGSGVWSGLSESQKKAANKSIKRTLRRTAPLKYRLARSLRRLRKFPIFSRFLPSQPLNE